MKWPSSRRAARKAALWASMASSMRQTLGHMSEANVGPRGFTDQLKQGLVSDGRTNAQRGHVVRKAPQPASPRTPREKSKRVVPSSALQRQATSPSLRRHRGRGSAPRRRDTRHGALRLADDERYTPRQTHHLCGPTDAVSTLHAVHEVAMSGGKQARAAPRRVHQTPWSSQRQRCPRAVEGPRTVVPLVATTSGWRPRLVSRWMAQSSAEGIIRPCSSVSTLMRLAPRCR